MAVEVKCCKDFISSNLPCDYYFNRKKKLIYYPSNSKKGIAIKGTNLIVELI